MNIKKISKYLLVLFALLFIGGCQNNSNEYTLPDLSGKSKTDIVTLLDEAEMKYEFSYIQDEDLAADTFVEYGNDLEALDIVSKDDLISIVLSTPNFVLPDLTGMNQGEILQLFISTGVNFSFEMEVNNDVTDQTFSKYGNEYSIGDPIASGANLTIYIGFNTTKLPDLTGMLVGQIERVLIEEQIQYSFEYVIDDNNTEDMFVEYKDFEIGDDYNDEVIVIVLYENTFTNADSSLIISKYIDGGEGTSDQAIEIYNPTNSAIDLKDYHIAIYENGSFEVTYNIPLTDISLGASETYVIANKASSNGDLLRKADLISDDLVFNGNDTIQLRYKNNTYIDTIYHIGNRDFVFDNEIFVRKAEVVSGTREFVFNQWTAYIPTYIDVLGTHPITAPDKITYDFINRDFYDPLGGMDLVTLVKINDGDTASFNPGFLDNERVRFLGVDTPETYPVQDPWGPEAKAYTTLILNSAIEIYIQSDPILGYKENYGRHLGLIWVNLGENGLTINILNSDDEVMRTEHLSGWILLNYHLVLNGYSYNYYGSESRLIFDNRYLYRWFQDAQLFAQENGLGIHEWESL